MKLHRYLEVKALKFAKIKATKKCVKNWSFLTCGSLYPFKPVNRKYIIFWFNFYMHHSKPLL